MSVIRYLNTGSATTGVSVPNGFWNRPAHRTTCCVSIYKGGSCCVCVPTTATCFVIEMWGQGGGGGGGCCCGSGPYGGQGGSYAWITCTTSGVNHILCACTCLCECSTCSICGGTPGQFSRVINCTCSPGGVGACVCGGVCGLWCCFWGGGSCCCSGSQWLGGNCCMNTWNFFKNCSACIATARSGGSSITPNCLVNCSCVNAQTTVCTNASLWSGCSTQTQPAAAAGTPCIGPLEQVFCGYSTCSCFTSPYLWQGSCGWADPALAVTPFGCLNSQGGPANGQCGGGMGVGGAAYAGGDQQWWNRCGFCCYQCYGAGGHFPGGGGPSSGGGTAWVLPGHGTSGLILISWS